VPDRMVRQVPSLRFGGLVCCRDDHRSTGYQGISDAGRLVPAMTVTPDTLDDGSGSTSHPFGSEILR
jgi:hypothetical protein